MTDTIAIIIVAVIISLLGLAGVLAKKKNGRGEVLAMDKKVVSTNQRMKGIGA